MFTNKQTGKVQSSPGQLLTSRPLRTDKRPPRAGQLNLQGTVTEKISPSWTSEPPAAPYSCRAALKAALDAALESALDYSLKLNDQIGAALKAALDDALDYALRAPFLEPEPLIDKFATTLKVIFFDIGEVPCCDFSKGLGKVIIFGKGRPGLTGRSGSGARQRSHRSAANESLGARVHGSCNAKTTPRKPLI